MRRRMTRLHASIGTAAALAGALLTGALFLPQSSVGQEAEIEIEKVEKEQPKGEAVTVRRVPGVGQADRAMALKATTLLDMDVNTRRGEDMGEIEDLVLDLNTGKIRFAVVSFGGFVDIGDKHVAVPWHALTLAREKDDPNELFIVLDRTKEQLKNAPAFEQGSWPESADQYWNRVEEFFGANEQETEVEIERE